MAWTAHILGQRLSTLLEIGDASVALEIDVVGAAYVNDELQKRDFEREKRDRDFWAVMFGGEPSEDIDWNGVQPEIQKPLSEDEFIARSALGR